MTVVSINAPQNNLGWATAKLQDVCDIIRGVAFSKDKKFENYEYIMSDIFDHIIASVSYFDLEISEISNEKGSGK